MVNGKEPGITLRLSVAEANFIFQLLGQQPFDTVAAIISKLKSQVDEQVNNPLEGETAPLED